MRVLYFDFAHAKTEASHSHKSEKFSAAHPPSPQCLLPNNAIHATCEDARA